MKKIFRGWINLKNFVFVGFLGVASLIIAFQLITSPEIMSPLRLPSTMVSYTSPEEHYTILKPKFWVATDFKNGLNDDPYAISIIDAVSHAGPGLTIAKKRFENENIEEITDWGVDRAHSCKEYRFIDGSMQPFTTDHLSGVQFSYSCSWDRDRFFLSEDWVPSRCIDYVFSYKTFGYILSFCALEEHWLEVEPTFKQMMDSFSLTGQR